MPCPYAIEMYRPSPEARAAGRNGKLTSDPAIGHGEAIMVPCGGCPLCKARKTAEWKVRMHCEMQMHPPESVHFVTFTYADEHLPADFSIDVREAQLLLKRIRNEYGNGIRYFLIGEFGDPVEHTGRPHYHAIFWGLHLDDLVPAEMSKGGFRQWTSERLEKCWGKGRVWVGTVDGGSMSYTCGYHHKKLGNRRKNGEYRNAFQRYYYQRVHSVTGEICQVNPEFALMSRRPGIGYSWAEKFKDHDLQHDFLMVDGKKRPMPKYLVGVRNSFIAPDLEQVASKEAYVAAVQEDKAAGLPRSVDVSGFRWVNVKDAFGNVLLDQHGKPRKRMERYVITLEADEVGFADEVLDAMRAESAVLTAADVAREDLIALAQDEARERAEEQAELHAEDLTPERLETREEAFVLKGKSLKRGFE